MDFVTEKILNILEADDCTTLDRMKLKPGLQVLCHNIWMASYFCHIRCAIHSAEQAFNQPSYFL